jgi:peptide/nickel transport system permease protein
MRTATHLLWLVARTIPTLGLVVIVSFLLMQLAPGDVVDYITAESGAADAGTTAAMRESFGLNASAWEQFVRYLHTLASGSLGISPRFNVPVIDLISARLPATLLLVALAIGLAALIGVAAGTTMALSAGRTRDRVLTGLTLLFYSLPSFWIGLMLMVLFAVYLGWLPTGGAKTLGRPLKGLDQILDRARYLVLPVLSLALYYIAVYARLTRAAVLDMRRQDYVRTAVAKGLSNRQVTLRHVLRNALIPVTTLAGMHVSAILGGAVVIETVFSWPGMGRLTYEAIQSRDYVLLLGILLTSALVVVSVNLLVDLLHSLLDPRIEARK